MKDFIKSLKTELNVENNTTTSCTLTTQLLNRLTEESEKQYLLILAEQKKRPKISEVNRRTIRDFWIKFRKENPNVLLSTDIVKSFLEFLLIFVPRRIQTINNVFSTKSIDNFKNNKASFNYHTKNSKKKKPIPFKVDMSFKMDETNRKLKLNTKEGFLHCIETTTLIHPESEHCPFCNNKFDCKELLKDNYPKIYKTRYGQNK